MNLRTLYSILFLGAVAMLLNACSIPDKKICFPHKQDNVLVYDLANVLDENEETALNHELNSFKANTSNVIVVITHPDFCGEEPFKYATDAGEDMGVGTADNDNGIVIVVGTEVHKAFIAVGKGLEGAIPDAYAKRIIEQEMLPEFRNDNYIGGIKQSVSVLKKLASGEISEYVGGASNNSKKKSKGFPIALVLMFFLFGGASLFGQIYRVRKYAALNDIAFWTAWSILANNRRSHGGSYSDFSGGRGPFGGGGGGGFGGFGGGSFGGGGAGGSW